MKMGDKWKMSFCYRYKHLEYLAMPFGLINAATPSQYMMNNILNEFLDKEVVVYMDAILIYFRNLTKHRLFASRVLPRLI